MQQETRDYPAAARSHQQALAPFSDRGNRPGHAEALTRLAEYSPGRRRHSRPTEPLPSQVPGKGRPGVIVTSPTGRWSWSTFWWGFSACGIFVVTVLALWVYATTHK
jgi:hypothetical protein